MKPPNQKKRRKTPLTNLAIQARVSFHLFRARQVSSYFDLRSAKYFADKIVGFDFAKASSTISSTALG
jgi:hypothetical protein